MKTARGVQVGRSTIAQMIHAYTGGGFSATSAFDSRFAGTYVRVLKRHRDVIGGFGERRAITIIAVPTVPVCD